jgi:hypothetical protein
MTCKANLHEAGRLCCACASEENLLQKYPKLHPVIFIVHNPSHVREIQESSCNLSRTLPSILQWQKPSPPTISSPPPKAHLRPRPLFRSHLILPLRSHRDRGGGARRMGSEEASTKDCTLVHVVVWTTHVSTLVATCQRQGEQVARKHRRREGQKDAYMPLPHHHLPPNPLRTNPLPPYPLYPPFPPNPFSHYPPPPSP